MMGAMRKRTLWIVLGVIVGLWLVPAVFVSLYDPSSPPEPDQTRPPGLPGGLLEAEPKFFLFSHGYTKHWTVETWEGAREAPPDATRASYWVARGPLDREAGTFKFSVSCAMNHARDLEAVRLLVTSASDWSGEGDDSIWAQVAETRVEEPGAEEIALTCEAVVPAATTAYRIQEVRGGVAVGGFSQSMLTAPTVLGRVYDAIAWRSLFSWVPDLR